VIVLKQIATEHGITYFMFEYDLDGKVFQIIIQEREIIEKLKQVHGLLGRKPSLQDLKEIIVQMINEVRKGRKPFLEAYDYSKFININLEA